MNKVTDRVIVYTAISDGYDELIEPEVVESGVDYICVTDKSIPSSSIWQPMNFPRHYDKGVLANRFVKMQPHELFPEYEKSLYIDGNIKILGGLKELFSNVFDDQQNIALYKHPFRSCVYEEAEECIAAGFDWFWKINQQMNLYKQQGFPPFSNLYECNIILRRHMDEDIKLLMNEWWNAFINGIKRDQLSLPFLAWKMDINVQNLGLHDGRFIHKHFFMNNGHLRAIPLLRRLRGKLNRQFG